MQRDAFFLYDKFLLDDLQETVLIDGRRCINSVIKLVARLSRSNNSLKVVPSKSKVWSNCFSMVFYIDISILFNQLYAIYLTLFYNFSD